MGTGSLSTDSLNTDSLSTGLQDLFSARRIWLAEREIEQAVPLVEAESDSVSFGMPEIDRVLPNGGLQRGALHEWGMQPELGEISHKTSSALATPALVTTLLAVNACKTNNEYAHPRIAIWIGRDIWPTPFALEATFSRQGFSRLWLSATTDNCIFIDPSNHRHFFWSLLLALRSPAVGVVVADCRNFDRKLTLGMTRRLALAARSSGALGLLIRDHTDTTRPTFASSRWSTKPLYSPTSQPRFELTLKSCKGSSLYNVQWNLEMGNLEMGNLEMGNLEMGNLEKEQLENLGAQNGSKQALSMRVLSGMVDQSHFDSESTHKNRTELQAAEGIRAYG